ncbi:MAG: MFS transporter [Hyphomicrobiales bacterium]|nr:MFS transporter [Hyphomicrobiales bacterium]
MADDGKGAATVFSDRDKRTMVMGVMLAMLPAALDQTVVAPAVRTMGRELGHADFSAWIGAAYFLTGTAVTPLYGKLADIRGRRPVMLLALSVFLFGSILCALSTSMPAMIAGRAIQGLGGGGLISLAQTAIADVVSPRERGKYIVYISTMWATASIVGPVVGGIIAQYLHWQFLFWMNLPLVAAALLTMNRLLRRLPGRRAQHRLDLLGAGLVVLATVALMLALTFVGQGEAWTSVRVDALFAGGAALYTWFAFHLARTPEPLIPLGVLRNPIVLAANGCMFFVSVVLIGATFYLPAYFQAGFGASSAQAGATLALLLGGTVIGANTMGRYMPRLANYKRIPVFALCIAFVALAGLGAFAGSLNYFAAGALSLFLGIGIGPMFPFTTISLQNATPMEDLGVATATLAFLRSLGSATGLAALGAILPASAVDSTATTPASAFAPLFWAMFASAAITFGFLLALRQLPLRGTTPIEAFAVSD